MPSASSTLVPALGLSQAIVHTSARLSQVGQKAVQVLLEEVAKRTQLRWQIIQEVPSGNGGVSCWITM